MTAPRFSRNRRWPASLALVSALFLVACGDDAEEPIIGGAAAPDETVTEDLKIASAQIEFPEDGLHEEGADVTLYAALTNTGTTSARLVDVEGPGFSDARLIPLDGDEGAIEVPPNDNAYLEPDGAPSVVLLDLDESLRSSQSLAVTFVFEEAGEVTMEVPVAADPPGEGGFEAPEDPTGES